MPVVAKESLGNKASKIDPRKEYVTGGVLSSGGTGTNTLSGFDGDSSLTNNSLGREHSVRTLAQMMEDPKISKDIHILKIGVLGDGVELLPSVAETDENYEEARILADFCERSLKRITSFPLLLCFRTK